MAYSIKLQIFEGPLDLLLHLIDRSKIDIRDIPLSSVTEQYMEYLALMETLDLEVASGFLVMAATLMDIKAKTLLPRPEAAASDEPDPREELVSRLLEYKCFKEAASGLRVLEARQALRYARPFPGYIPDWPSLDFLGGITIQDVARALRDALGDIEEEWTHIPPEEVNYRSKMREVVLRLSRNPGRVSLFRDLLKEGSGRLEVIVTFLVVLELARLKRVIISQPSPFGEIEMVYSRRRGVRNDEGTSSR